MDEKHYASSELTLFFIIVAALHSRLDIYKIIGSMIFYQMYSKVFVTLKARVLALLDSIYSTCKKYCHWRHQPICVTLLRTVPEVYSNQYPLNIYKHNLFI
jgi:hypothetical protein